MTEKVFKTQIDVTVTGQDVDDIMSCALEGGICYWCCKAEVVGKYLGDAASDQISRGGSLLLHDAESSDRWELNIEKFMNGLKMWLNNGLCGDLVMEGGRIDCCNIDADDADSIIQYAVFGEIVFG